jgi:hypothetical protein
MQLSLSLLCSGIMTTARKPLKLGESSNPKPPIETVGQSAELDAVPVPSYQPTLTPMQQKTLANIMSGAEYVRIVVLRTEAVSLRRASCAQIRAHVRRDLALWDSAERGCVDRQVLPSASGSQQTAADGAVPRAWRVSTEQSTARGAPGMIIASVLEIPRGVLHAAPQNMRKDEETERAIVSVHAEERLDLESLSLLKYKRWLKGAMSKFEEQKQTVRKMRAFTRAVVRPPSLQLAASLCSRLRPA